MTQVHDKYGKALFRKAVGNAFISAGPSVKVELGSGTKANIDGVIGKEIAVEIESRVNKQVRGAIMDLILHPFKKKMLVLIPVHMNNPQKSYEQCIYILRKFLDHSNFKVVLLMGDGKNPQIENDVNLIRKAINQLI